MFILDRIDRKLHSLERLELKFDSSLEFFDKIPVRILLDVLFSVFRFSKAIIKVSVKENEVPTQKNSSRASIFATKASYISN